MMGTMTTAMATRLVTGNNGSNDDLSPPFFIAQLSSNGDEDGKGESNGDWLGCQYAMTTWVTKTAGG